MDEFLKQVFSESGLLAGVLLIAVVFLWRHNLALSTRLIDLVIDNTISNTKLAAAIERELERRG